MKKNCIFLFSFFAITAAAATCYDVRLPAEAKPFEITAKTELMRYLGKMGVRSFSVGGRGDIVFHIGDTDFARKNGIVCASLKDEQWLVRSFGGDVVLAGGGTRGTLYAVSRFLEDRCGVRWWSPVEEDVPRVSELVLPELDMGGKPAFAGRNIYAAVSEERMSPFAVHCRLNGFESADGKNAAAYGGWFRAGSPSHCHTLERYIPADKYLKTHPEWFSYDRATKRRVGGMLHGQLCWTNPEVRAEMKKRLRAYIEADRKKAAQEGVPPPVVYEISENDNTHYCECDECMAARGKWNLSGLNLDFVNDIAASVKDDYPEIFVRTFAYERTETPPKGGKTAADNVIVRLCDTKSNMAAGMYEKGNTTFAEFLSAWAKAAKHLAVWDYAITFTRRHGGFPFPSEFHYGEYFRACRAAGVREFFWEHENPWRADMWELKFFLERKLMEDPSLDDGALIARFMREYYGPAGTDVRSYRERLAEIRKAKSASVKWFPVMADFDWIGDDDMRALQGILARAEAATNGAEPYLSRVRRARLGLDRLLCQRERAARGGILSETGRAAEARVRAFWPEWARRFKSVKPATVSDAIANELGLPKPAKFKNDEIVDFPAVAINRMAVDGSMRLEDDPRSEVGRAVVFDGKIRPTNASPFQLGVYDRGNKKSLAGVTLTPPAENEGYGWHKIGTVDVPVNGFVWFTRSWMANLSFKGMTNLHGRGVDVWVSVRFERDGESVFTYVDRVVLVKHSGKEQENAH